MNSKEENDFLKDLLAGIDPDDIVNAVPTPVTTPVKKRLRPKSPEKENFSAAELESLGWDWDIEEDDFLTPQKRKSPLKANALSPRKKTIPPPFAPKQPAWNSEPSTRCIIEFVEEINPRETHLRLSLTSDPSQTRSARLYDDWVYTPIKIGDTVNIIGHFSDDAIQITTKSNFLIHHPDILITATALSNATACTRKPLLSSMLKSTTAGGDGTTPSLVWGNMVHEIVQEFLEYKLNILKGLIKPETSDGQWLEERIERVVMEGLLHLFKISVEVEQAKREVRMRIQGLMEWMNKYISHSPNSEAVLSDTRATASSSSIVAITSLHAIEEDIWSPKFGLKGMLDATISITIQDSPGNTKLTSFFPRTNSPSSFQGEQHRVAPLEIKTGRSIGGMEHRAQTMLYTLLAEERYHQPVEGGLLYYTQGKQQYAAPPKDEQNGQHHMPPKPNEKETSDQIVLRVPRNRNEIKALIQARNSMADWMMKRARMSQQGGKNTRLDESLDDSMEETRKEDERFLPECIDEERTCSRCYAVDACMLFRKTIEYPTNAPPLSGKLESIFENKTSHLTPSRCAFFKKWEELISLEEQDQMRFKKEIWTLSAKERERTGRCFADMRIISGGLTKDLEEREAALSGSVSSGHKFHKFRFTFTKHDSTLLNKGGAGPDDESAPSLLNGHIAVGDAVTVSIEPHLVAFSRGFVVHITPREVILGVEMDIGEASIRSRWGDYFHSSDDTTTGGAPNTSVPIVYRIDRDEMSIGMTRVRDNLAQIFYAHGDSRRLELVVDLKAPEFQALEEGQGPLPCSFSLTPPLQAVSTSPSHLNCSQQAAVTKVLQAKDYALILGMPGTGKTTVIAEIVRRLVGMGKTVLVTSYTHSAVDNILKKISPPGVGDDPEYVREDLVLRIGNEDKVHPDAKRFTLSARPKARSLEMLERQLMMPSVVATTCLTIDHALFSRRQFNYCIVDEASQITLPTCLGPLRFADKFILVGDHFQLPPLVRNRQARRGGLETSLFRMLSEAHPQAVVDLTEQYRMNEDIMYLSNRLIYGDRLRCGDEETKNRALKIPDETKFLQSLHTAGSTHSGTCWLQRILDERCKVVFIDTDGLPAPDSRVGDLVHNPTEAELVRQLTEMLISSGVPEDQIGVISLYRQQIKLLSAMLDGKKDVEIMTADRSQGRDKEVVIISMVRSNVEGKVGELVKDWRRINVSFTRAKSKLVIFGSRSTLRTTTLLNEFFDLIQDKDWIFELSPGDHQLHHSAIPWSSSHTQKSLGVDIESLSPPSTGMMVSEDDGTAPVGSQRFKCSQSSSKSYPGSQTKPNFSTIDPTPPSTKRARGGLPSSQNADDSDEIEIVETVDVRPTKKPKSERSGQKRATMGEEALTRGRPLLLDLMNDDK